MKKKYLAWIINGPDNIETIEAHKYILEKFSENFDKMYFINIKNLKLFNKQLQKKPINQEYLPFNFIYFEPRSFFEFKNFLKDKKLIAVSNFGKDFEDLKKHLILNLLDIKFFQISNLGNLQWTHKAFQTKSILFKINLKFIKFYSQKLINFLSIVGLVPRIQIRFISNLDNFENMKKNKFKLLMKKFKLFYAKEHILVNSRTYDQFLDNQSKISEDYIVLLDYDINHPDDILSGANISAKNIEDHYNNLNLFLDNLSKKYNKKVIVSIHPRAKLSEKKNFFPKYDIFQFKTLDCIKKAFIVIFFDTSAIIDAIILKKRIITLKSNNLARLALDGSNKYSSTIGIYQEHLDTFDASKIVKIVEETEKRIQSYDQFIDRNIIPAGKEAGEGYKKIINTVKERFF